MSESKTSREDAMAGRNIADRFSAVVAIKRLHEEDLFPEICTNTYPLETKKRWLRCQVTYCNYGH